MGFSVYPYTENELFCSQNSCTAWYLFVQHELYYSALKRWSHEIFQYWIFLQTLSLIALIFILKFQLLFNIDLDSLSLLETVINTAESDSAVSLPQLSPCWCLAVDFKMVWILWLCHIYVSTDKSVVVSDLKPSQGFCKPNVGLSCKQFWWHKFTLNSRIDWLYLPWWGLFLKNWVVDKFGLILIFQQTAHH